MMQTIVQIGNSAGVIIPKNLRDVLGLKPGSKVVVEKGSIGESLVIRKESDTKKRSSVTPEFMHIAAGIASRYDTAFKKLAKK